MVEIWLKPEVDTQTMKIGGVDILVEEGVVIRRVQAVGMKRVIPYLRGVQFYVSHRGVLKLGNCLGTVGPKGIRYEKGDEGLLSMTRYMDIELKRGMTIPPKLQSGGRTIQVSYTGQLPACNNCLRPRRDCESWGFATKCRHVR